MRKARMIRAIATAAFSAVAVSVWSQQLAQPKPVQPALPTINFQSPEGSVPQDWTLRPRPPIQFTPFDMVDPNTGKPVHPDEIITVNGVKMRAGDFYRQLNAMEQWLNEQGYSLRTDTYFEYFSPTLEAELAESEAYARWLEENAPLNGEEYGEGSDFSMASTYTYSNSWNSQWLGNSLFGIQVGGSIFAQANLSPPISGTARGEGVVRGRLANYQSDIATANGRASVSLNSNGTVNWAYQVAINVFGRQVWGDQNSGSFAIYQTYQRSWNFPIAQVNWNSPPIPLFCVGVLGINICANGQVGISGRVNLAASINANLIQQQASANPYGSIGGYAAAWIGFNGGIARVEVGVRGNLNFLSGGISGNAQGRILSLYPPAYEVNASLTASLNALSGNLQGYARGCIWFFGWRCAEASATLFSWNGWSYNGTLIRWYRRFP